MPLDFIGQTINALWALFEANADWTAKLRPGNRIKLLGAANPYPQKPNRNAADFGEAVITLAGGGAGAAVAGPQRAPRTFANAGGVAGAPFLFGAAESYLLAVTFDEERYDNADAVAAATVYVLASAGAKLGMPSWVKGWSYRHARRIDRAERPRVVDEFTITVEYAIPSQVLLAS